LITGGGGVLGQLLARRLLERAGLAARPGEAGRRDELVLLDTAFTRRSPDDPRVRCVIGDIADAALLDRLFADGIDRLFHLAAVVSAGAEADFDLGLRVNLDGLRTVLEAARRARRCPRVVFTSSVAAFGGELPAVIRDTTAATPQSSYGTQKVIGELLISDMTRKGFIDGRTLRLPTIVIRPGKANRAASGFMSNILREPIAGIAAVCPVPQETAMWIASPASAVDALIHAIELPAERWGWNRTLNAPGITVSVAQALAALENIAGGAARARVRFEADPAIERIVLSWPAHFATERAFKLGFHSDTDIAAIIRAHIAGLAR
jgi:nucleoside-diphosphate-sugar epimerase